MTYTGRITLLALTLALCLVSGPQLLFGGPFPDPQPGGVNPPDKLDEIQKQIKILADAQKKQFGDLNEQLAESFTAVKNDIEKLQKDLKNLKTDKAHQELKIAKLQEKLVALEEAMGLVQLDLNTLKTKVEIKLFAPTDKADILDMKARLEKMEKDLSQLKNGNPYIAKFPPTGTRKVLLVNNTAEVVTYLLNGKEFRVLPGGMTAEFVPAGTVMYEVYYPGWGRIKQKTTVVQPNEVFNITVG